jgi:WD40 repeat protein
MTETKPSVPGLIDANPFKGPVPLQAGDKIFGRTREIQDLLVELAANRLVVVHSVSGCGKSSLIEAGLRPRLPEVRLAGLPTIRLPRRGAGTDNSHSTLIATAIASLNPAKALADANASSRAPGDSAPTTNLDEFLRDRRARLTTAEARAFDLLIFDQFEEVFDGAHVTEGDRVEFFRQVGLALKDKSRWALFSIREDYLGALEPYVGYLPTYLSARFRLTQLPIQAAEEAILGLSNGTNVPFEPLAASQLAHELSRTGTQPKGDLRDASFVEPVYLQVVCRYLWNACLIRGKVAASDVTLPTAQMSQGDADAQERQSPVDRALEEYYADELKALPGVRKELSLSKDDTDVATERVVREWFEGELITDRSVRRQVQRGPALDAATSASILRQLEDRYLIRRDERLGPVWYELSHDRLIGPILSNNVAWSIKHLKPFQRLARTWRASGSHQSVFLDGRDLEEAKEWAESHPSTLLPYDSEFIAHSEKLQQTRNRDKKSRFIRYGLAAALVLSCVVAAVLAIAINDGTQKRESGQLALASTTSLTSDPERSLLIGLQAAYRRRQGFTPEVKAALNAALQSSRLLLREDMDSVPYGIAFSREIFEFATASVGGSFKLTDAFTGETRDIGPTIRTRPRTGLYGAPFAYTGRLMAYVGDSGGVEIVEVGAGATTARKQAETKGNVYSVDIDPTNRFVAVATSSGVFTRFLAEGTGWSRDGGAIGVAINKDEHYGPYIVTARADGVLQLHDPRLSRVLFQLKTDGLSLSSVDISPKSDYVAVGTSEGQLLIWAPRQRIFGVLAQFATAVTSVKYSPNGLVLAAGQSSGEVTLFRAPRTQIRNVDANGDPSRPLETEKNQSPQVANIIAVLRGHAKAVRSLDFSRDSLLLATASEDRSAAVWDASETSIQSGLLAVAISDDSTTTARLTESLDAGGKLQQTITTTRNRDAQACMQCDAIALSGDGRRLAIAGSGGVTLVKTPSGGKILLTSEMKEAYTYDVALSDDGHMLATSGTSGLRLWDVDNQRELPLNIATMRTSKRWGYPFVLPRKSIPVRSIAVRSQERKHDNQIEIELAAGYEDGTVAVWVLVGGALLEDGNPRLLTKRHESPIASLAFGKDARHGELAAVDADGLIVRWDLKTLLPIEEYRGPVATFGGQFVRAPQGYNGANRELAVGGIASGRVLTYDHLGAQLASGGLDGLRVYDLQGQGDSSLQLFSGRPTIAVAFAANGEKVVNVVGVDAEGRTYVNWLDDDLLAQQVQKSVTRPLTDAECASYLSSLRPPLSWSWSGVVAYLFGDSADCGSDKAAFGHFLKAEALARAARRSDAVLEAKRRSDAISELKQAGKYRWYAERDPSRYSKWVDALTSEANGRRSKALGPFDPKTALSQAVETYRLRPDDETVFDILSSGERLAKDGSLEAAAEFYAEAANLREGLFLPQTFKEVPRARRQVFEHLNNICWYGASFGKPEIVLPFCTFAVEIEGKPGLARDNRALVHARANRSDLALADMDAYLGANEGSAHFEDRTRWRTCFQTATDTHGSGSREADACTLELMVCLGGTPTSGSGPLPRCTDRNH